MAIETNGQIVEGGIRYVNHLPCFTLTEIDYLNRMIPQLEKKVQECREERESNEKTLNEIKVSFTLLKQQVEKLDTKIDKDIIKTNERIIKTKELIIKTDERIIETNELIIKIQELIIKNNEQITKTEEAFKNGQEEINRFCLEIHNRFNEKEKIWKKEEIKFPEIFGPDSEKINPFSKQFEESSQSVYLEIEDTEAILRKRKIWDCLETGLIINFAALAIFYSFTWAKNEGGKLLSYALRTINLTRSRSIETRN